MRLAALLAELPVDQLERLAAEHLGQDETVSRTALCTTLEGVLRSYSFVRRFVCDRLPPTFASLEVLLEADGWTLPATTFRETVEERTSEIVQRVASGDLVGRDASLRLYRRVLVEARRNDLILDASETAILGVLRRELGIRPVEHFVLEHHPDFHEFWNDDQAFLRESHALRSFGLVFGHAGNVLLAEEVVPLVRQTLGFETSSASRRRLYERLSSAELAEVLEESQLRTSGSRDERLDRVLSNFLQPTEVLRTLQLQTLRDLCRDVNATVSGSKDELIERLVEYYLHDLDIRPLPDLPPPVVRDPEPRTLDERRFRGLFGSLKGDELTDVLVGIESSRITGAKDAKVDLLWNSPFAEATLLETLTNRVLEEVLDRHRLRTAGSKRERVDRLVEHFRTLPDAALQVENAGRDG